MKDIEVKPTAVPSARYEPPVNPGSYSRRQVVTIICSVMAGSLLAAIDGSIVTTALPTIVGELGGIDQLSWVVAAYLLTSTATLPLYGKLSDMIGRGLVFQGAVLIFLAGSALAGLSRDMTQLVFFRGVQGVGAGGLTVVAMAIVGEVTSPRERGRYIGYMGAMFAVATIGAPLLGGYFVDHLSWRWIFYINLPIGGAVMAIASSALRLPFPRSRHRLDVEGALLLVTSISCLFLVSIWGGHTFKWGSTPITTLVIVAVSSLGLFIVQENRATEPLMPLRLFRERTFVLASSIGFAVGCSIFGALVFLPLFLQVVTKASASTSGLLLAPMMSGLILTAVVSGRAISRTGRYRAWPITGLAVSATGMFLLSRMNTGTGRLQASVGMVVLGMGLGMCMQVLVLMVQNTVHHRDLGVATAAVNFFRQMGGTIGVAVFGAIFAARFRSFLTAHLSRFHNQALESSGLADSPENIQALPDTIRNTVVQGIADSTHVVFFVAAIILVCAFALSWMIRHVPLRETVHIGPPLTDAKPI